jgi:SAM-dependent methyltransferase
MGIEKVHASIPYVFGAWVAVMEAHTRHMEVRDSELHDARILIISAPTDGGIAALARANASGQSLLLCLTAEIEAIAKRHCRRRDIRNLTTVVAPFFRIPTEDEEFDAVYANCFFDLCDPPQIKLVADEIWRVLKQGGHLYTVHMGQPAGVVGRLWAWLVQWFPFGGGGFRPVSVAPALFERGFRPVREEAPERLGFPLRYLQAAKPGPA